MVAVLLGQVVGDAGSIEPVSTVLALPLDSLLASVRWFVSRGSNDAACCRWSRQSATRTLAERDGAADLVGSTAKMDRKRSPWV